MALSQEELEEFNAESLELLEAMEKIFLSLDQGGDFPQSYDFLFRTLHNLKGSAALMELNRLAAHTHELENILVGFKGKDSLPKEYISLFLRGIDATRLVIAGQEVNFDFSVKIEGLRPEAPAPELPQSAVEEFVTECEETIERVAKTLAVMESGSLGKEALDELYRDVHSMKGTAFLFSFELLGATAHAMESSLENVRNETHDCTPELLDALFKSLKQMEMLVQRIKAKQPFEDQAATVQALAETLARTSANLPLRDSKPTNPEAANPGTGSQAKSDEGAGSIRVPVALLDSLMTLMGEMVLVRNQVLQYSNRTEDLEFASMSKRLNVVTSEIQGELMKTRMQPIGNVLGKFNRVVRDLSHELGKGITLSISGAETELDKSLLEAIKDPLTHIVRNSCDHGIETPEVRRKSGKPEAGSISIRAFHEGGQVVVEVGDDGKGLNKEVLLKKAVEKGLITQAQTVHLSEKEIFQLIFAPGFSTAAKVTNVSGRGVGMDVVRTNIERIGGTVDLSSRSGIGTTIKIKIPLTLAIVPALIVKVGDGTFAIPQVQLEELVRVDAQSEQQIEILHGSPVYRLRGNILPLIDLSQLLGLSKEPPARRVTNIAVLNAEGCSFGVIIDEVQDTADIVVKPINRLLKSIQAYSGATVLGDGSIALIFDVLGISKMAQIARERSKSIEASERASATGELQDFLLFSLNSKTTHALVLSYVHRLEVFKASEIENSGQHRVIRYGDLILPLISANAQLGYGDSAGGNAEVPVVVIERRGQLYGIEVNAILDTMSTDIEMTPEMIRQTGIFGNLNMKDRLIVVVDPFELIGRSLGEPVEQELTWSSANARVSDDKLGTASEPRLRNILLVEDNVFFRRSIKSLLEKDGYEVMTANNGEEALDLLGQHSARVALIVSDIEMPRLNGLQLATRVRQQPSLQHIPMMAVSSLADRRAIQRGTEAGFDAYLEKLKPGPLLSKVAELTKRNNGVAA